MQSGDHAPTYLACSEAISTHSPAQLSNHTQDTLRGHALGGNSNVLKGKGQKSIPRKDSNVLAINLQTQGGRVNLCWKSILHLPCHSSCMAVVRNGLVTSPLHNHKLCRPAPSYLMVCWPATSKVIIVHGREVIMDQRHGVHNLHGASGGHSCLDVTCRQGMMSTHSQRPLPGSCSAVRSADPVHDLLQRQSRSQALGWKPTSNNVTCC